MKHRLGYGIQWPRWWVRRRGYWWLKHGFCPMCYSSPPQKDCLVCSGNQNYGPNIKPLTRIRWRQRWAALTKEK